MSLSFGRGANYSECCTKSPLKMHINQTDRNGCSLKGRQAGDRPSNRIGCRLNLRTEPIYKIFAYSTFSFLVIAFIFGTACALFRFVSHILYIDGHPRFGSDQFSCTLARNIVHPPIPQIEKIKDLHVLWCTRKQRVVKTS